MIKKLHQTNLLHQANQVVEQPFFHDLSVLPVSHGTELDLELFVSRRDYTTVGTLHRSLHSACEISHGAGIVAITEQDLIWIVGYMVIWERLEALHGFGVVSVTTTSGLRLPRPEYGHVIHMEFVERLPILCIPSIMQNFDQF